MSSARREPPVGITLEDVFRVLAGIEEEHHVNVHYVIRRDPSVRSKLFGHCTVFARRVGCGDEATTIYRLTRVIPTSECGTTNGILFRMALDVDLRLDELERLHIAQQEPLFRNGLL